MLLCQGWYDLGFPQIQDTADILTEVRLMLQTEGFLCSLETLRIRM